MRSAAPAIEQWVGRRASLTEVIGERPVRQLAAALDDVARLQDPASAPLPAAWHWAFFNPVAPQSGLGPDGHPRRGDFLPPVDLPRRMWAGSRLHWTRAFTVGAMVTRDSRIARVERKSGRSGAMVFVTVAHHYRDTQGLLLDEEHDIVYRDGPTQQEQDALALLRARVRAGDHVFERSGTRQQAVHADSVLLFRYSAATFNGHRIHYDADYCCDVEGYPGLVVHGPLVATLLLDFVARTLAPHQAIRSFVFRARKPTFAIGPLHLHIGADVAPGEPLAVWSTNSVGEVGLDAQVVLG